MTASSSWPRLAALAVLAQAACAPAEAPHWTSLVPLAELQLPDGGIVTRHPLPSAAPSSGRSLELLQVAGQASLRFEIERADWMPAGERGLWRVPLALPRRTGTDALVLAMPGGELPRVPLADLLVSEEPGFNLATQLQALVVRGPGGTPPERATLTCELAPSRCGPEERASGISGDAVTLLPGVSATARLDLPRGGVLRFATAAQAVVGGMAGRPVRFLVRLDGQPLFQHEMDARASSLDWHAVRLPPGGRPGAVLTFELDGPLARGHFLDPRVGPAEVGRRGERPWGEVRPDLVLFVADTFRADNLAACGGELGLTAGLDALADEGLCFTRARSAAAWTLPSHATLFSGRYPPEVVAPGGAASLAASVETLAERLAAVGYRTGAFTDGGFVSGAYGLAQGFAVFHEQERRDQDARFAAVRDFLAADDGRPVFLFVQTYRTHWPYEVSERTRVELGERMDFPASAEAVLADVMAEVRALGFADVSSPNDLVSVPDSPRLRELQERLRRLYLGGVADLDRALVDLLADFRGRGLLDHGVLLFTSDHGEAFGEHAGLFHTGIPFEEQVHVPLLLVGRGIRPGRSAAPVSAIDVAPTLVELAGARPDPAWPGRSLLDPEAVLHAPRALLAFQEANVGRAFSVLESDRKILTTPGALEEGRLLGAYDLARDPLEREDLSASADWAREQLERHAAALAALLASDPEDGGAQASDEKLEQLRALGY